MEISRRGFFWGVTAAGTGEVFNDRDRAGIGDAKRRVKLGGEFRVIVSHCGSTVNL